MRYKKILLFFLIFISITTKTFSADTDTKQDSEILISQKESFGISSFIKEAEKYTKDTFDDISMNEVLNSAILGEIDNNTIINKIINLFGKELKSMLKVLRYNFSYYCYT